MVAVEADEGAHVVLGQLEQGVLPGAAERLHHHAVAPVHLVVAGLGRIAGRLEALQELAVHLHAVHAGEQGVGVCPLAASLGQAGELLVAHARKLHLAQGARGMLDLGRCSDAGDEFGRHLELGHRGGVGGGVEVDFGAVVKGRQVVLGRRVVLRLVLVLARRHGCLLRVASFMLIPPASGRVSAATVPPRRASRGPRR